MDQENVDLLVIGSGKAGKTPAMDQARAGRKVVMVLSPVTVSSRS
jgi:pyruvate/2-oxoglutarate dehydrogenase complex dihydrolipoamide dehydrogenase (E3) component